MPDQTASRRPQGPRARAVGRLWPGRSDRPAQNGSAGAWRQIIRRRVIVAAVLFATWTVAIEARLIYLQVVTHAELVARAERQQLRTITAPAKRGAILDRHGRVLAYSVDADSIYAVPNEIGNAARATDLLCRALVNCTDAERRTLIDRLNGDRAFAWVRRQVTPDQARRVAALKLQGVGFLKENRRYYPKKELAAHLLGYVGIDSNGLAGVEATYDAQVRGRDGKILFQTDARRHALFSRVERSPTTGATLELTIDQYIQHIAERELRLAVDEHRAQGGSIVVMDPGSGEILALANWPPFNPNVFQRATENARRNRAIQDLYEPGSTFKIVTASAALEEAVLGPLDLVDVSAGTIGFGSRVISDVRRHGVLSFADVIVKSSNVGAIKIGLQLGAERLERYARRFGFGQAVATDFSGESPGIVWSAAQLDDSALASMAMGYQVGVTPLQMAAAANAVANGGELVEPHLVRAVIRDGRRVERPRQVIRRAISPETAALVTSIMEAVVERGTGQRARVPGYHVAGKTGTAAKLIDRRYSRSDYNASFVGFVPARQPALTVLVVIDTPRAKGYFGSVVAAPVFARVAEATLRHLGIGPTMTRPPVVLVARRDEQSQTPTPRPVRMAAPLTRQPGFADRQGLMPDLRGLSAREALRALAELGLGARVIGDGFVVEQGPPPGTPLERGGVGRLVLRRQLSLAGGTRP